MTRFGLDRWLGWRPAPAVVPLRQRLRITEWPAAVYAIGDVHGCIAQLRLLHRRILDDAAEIAGEKLIVGLGDYVDRGVDAAGVLDFLTARTPSDIQHICLAGNHEVMMLDHIAAPRDKDEWLSLGGIETLTSYGIDPQRYIGASVRERRAILHSHIPDQHLEFLQSLPTMLALPGAIFVHAGLRPGVALDDQSDEDLLLTREQWEYASETEGTPLVIHGHTAAVTPTTNGRNIGIDTGAFATGVLTAIRLKPGEAPAIISVSAADGV